MVRWLLVSALALAGFAVSACTLFDDEPPGNACMTDTECFRAQGESCNPQTQRCEVRPDAAVVLDAPVVVDAPVDAGVDAP